MTRPKPSDQLAKRGPKSQVGPKKLAWLHKFYDEWKAAEGRNTRGQFYRRLTQLWFQAFGYELPFNDDPAGIVEMETVLLETSTAGLTEEEVQRMAVLARQTNTVRPTHLLHYFCLLSFVFLFPLCFLHIANCFSTLFCPETPSVVP